MYWSFIAAATLIELTPGPNMTWLAVLGASRGRKVALAAVAGICLGLSIAAVIAGLGLTAVLWQFPTLFHLLRWAGALFLLYLAWEAWQDSDDTNDLTNTSTGLAFRQGLITNILNPKAYLFYAAMLPQFVSGQMPPATEIAVLSAIYVAIATIIHFGIAVLSGTAATFLQASPYATRLRKVLAILIAITAIWFFVSVKVPQ